MLEHLKIFLSIVAIAAAMVYAQVVLSAPLESVSIIDSTEHKEKTNVVLEFADGSVQIIQVDKRELKDEEALVKKIMRERR
jgi:hypothetical protein